MKCLYLIFLYLAGNVPPFLLSAVPGGGGPVIKGNRLVNSKAPVTKAPVRWKKVNDQVTGHIPRAQLLRMRATVEGLKSFLEDSCLGETGLSPTWRGMYAAQKMEAGVELRFGIECQFSTGVSTATLRVIANDMAPLFSRLTVNHQDFLTLPSVPVEREGCSYFETDEPNAGVHRDLLLVTTASGELPYIPVSRREYLLIVQEDLNAIRERIVTGLKERTPVRSAAVQAAAKRRDLETLAAQYTGADLETRKKLYLKRYKTDEEYQKAEVDEATAGVDSAIYVVGGLLRHLSRNALDAPAVISPRSGKFEGFRDGEPGMVMLVRLNPVFADAVAEPEKPRFFLISWDSNAADADAAATFGLISKKLDMCILQRMLERS
jgi:hypothetical protein